MLTTEWSASLSQTITDDATSASQDNEAMSDEEGIDDPEITDIVKKEPVENT